MSFSIVQLVVIFGGSLFFSAFFSMLEAAVISQDKHRVQHLAEEGERRAVIMQRLLLRADRLLSALLLCNNLANVTCAATATAIAARLMSGGDTSLVAVTLIVTFILLVFGEIAPKVVGVRYSSAIALTLAPLLDRLIKILKPLIAVVNFCSNSLLFLVGFKKDKISSWHKAMSFGELRAAVRRAARDAANSKQVSPDHYHVVEKSLHFNELPVERLMTPRRDISGINLQEDIDAIRAQIETTQYSKLVLFDGNIDNVCGVISTLRAIKLIKDELLSAETLKSLCGSVNYIPAAATALQQLNILRRQQTGLSLVVDGSGRVIGLITFTNFAAAIIGDETLPPVQRRPDGALLVSGETTLLQLEQMQPGARVPDDIDATTLNGIILEHLGDLPEKIPLCVKIKDWRMEILQADDKSIQSVALLPPEQRRDDS